jgi:hypothetical protein
MWDLRKALIAESSDRDAAVRLADRLFYAAVRRASSIPATLIEILAADDDDGDLANGTPHECAIRAAFGRHGLRTLAGEIDAAGLVPSATTAPQPVRLTLIGEDQRCGDTITDVRLEWRPRDGGQPGNAAATAADDVWTAPLTLPADGEALFFRFRVRFADGSDMDLPRQPRRSVAPALPRRSGAAVLHRLRDQPVHQRLAGRWRRRRHLAMGTAPARSPTSAIPAPRTPGPRWSAPACPSSIGSYRPESRPGSSRRPSTSAPTPMSACSTAAG